MSLLELIYNLLIKSIRLTKPLSITIFNEPEINNIATYCIIWKNYLTV